MEKEDDYTVSFCPSFSCYTGGGQIVETAERVLLEYSDDESDDEFEFIYLRQDCDFVFPVFNEILITNSSAVNSSQPPATVTTQLRDLIFDDSSKIEGISSEVYCIWTPEIGSLASSSSSSSSRSSSSSTSTSSRRWRIKDLLKRSYSEVKQMLKKDEAKKKKKKKKEKEKINAMKEEEKRKLYFPYRQKNYYSFLMSL